MESPKSQITRGLRSTHLRKAVLSYTMVGGGRLPANHCFPGKHVAPEHLAQQKPGNFLKAVDSWSDKTWKLPAIALSLRLGACAGGCLCMWAPCRWVSVHVGILQVGVCAGEHPAGGCLKVGILQVGVCLSECPAGGFLYKWASYRQTSTVTGQASCR